MTYSSRLTQFNHANFLPKGWFWLMRSADLKVKQAKAARFLNHDLAVFRGESGQVRILDAYCPHMGAHLGDGIVKENALSCLFHNWTFDGGGRCTAIPNQKTVGNVNKLRAYKACEKYGLIWIWTGDAYETESVPEVPELAGLETDSLLGTEFTKNCHPNVVMINAIDANHFNTVHKLVVRLDMQHEYKNQQTIRFHNVTRVPSHSFFTSLIGHFYSAALTYDMTYWYGHTGTVTLGPDFQHFHIMFVLRPTIDGKTEGQTILITKKQAGALGRVLGRILLLLTRVVGNYFAKGDTIIFNKIKFNLGTPVAADSAIIQFIKHYEEQPQATAFTSQDIHKKPVELAGHA